MKGCCEPAEGDPLGLLLERRGEFVSFVSRKVGDPGAADDIVQSSFVKAAERLDQLESESSAVAWFYRMLRNAIVDRNRRESALERAVTSFAHEQLDTADAVERRVNPCRCVSRLVDTLKPEYAEAIRRIDVDELTVKAFAEEKGITQGNAAVRVFRAREALRKKLEATCGSCAASGGCFDCTCAPPS